MYIYRYFNLITKVCEINRGRIQKNRGRHICPQKVVSECKKIKINLSLAILLLHNNIMYLYIKSIFNY